MATTTETGNYAIRISDLMYHDLDVPHALMIAPVIQSRQKVQVAPDELDGWAVVLECDDVRAKAIITVLQRYSPHILRAYRRGPRGGWHSYKTSKTS